MPDDETLDELKIRLENLNDAISEIEGLGSAYHIGASYLLKFALYSDFENPFEELWQNHLECVLSEYLRGTENAAENLETLKKAWNDDEQKIQDEKNSATKNFLEQTESE